MPSRSSRLRPTLNFSVLLAASTVLWLGPLRQAVNLALTDEKYTHAILAFIAALGLLWLNWRSDEGNRQSCAWAAAIPIVAALLQAYSYRRTQSSDLQLSLSMATFVIWCIGSYLLCFGTEAFRKAIFPLLILFWMVPIPNAVLNPVISGLQRGSAISAQLLFWLSRTPVSLNGLVLTTPTLELEIAPECSSIRSSLILIVTTMIVAQVLLSSGWRKAAVVAFAIPLSVAKNGLRIFTIGWMTEHVDARVLDSPLHHQGGVIFLSVALLAVFLFLWILRRGERRAISAPALPKTSNMQSA